MQQYEMGKQLLKVFGCFSISLLILSNAQHTHILLHTLFNRDDSDAEEMIKFADQLLTQVDTTQLPMSITSLDRTMLHQLSYTARGVMAPLCACMGGVVAQETLKALTGKYMPINQWVCVLCTCVCVFPFLQYSYSLMPLSC